MLVQTGAKVDSPGKFRGGSPTIAAASTGNVRIVEFLIGKGANVHSARGYYRNLLQTTSFLGHTETVEILLKNGVDVNAEK